MLATELIQRLQAVVSRYGDLPVFDWDNDEITTTGFNGAETVAYGGWLNELRALPDRIILHQEGGGPGGFNGA